MSQSWASYILKGGGGGGGGGGGERLLNAAQVTM